MKKFLLRIFKPKGAHAKWLVFLVLLGTLALGSGGYFETVREYLDTPTLTFKAGSYEISAYDAISALLVIAFIFWVTAILADFLESHINKVHRMRSATRTLITKIVHIAIYVIAFLVALEILGIDLTTLTVFSGAVGIGLGFGLQKIASNFISGLILLLEKAVEQGDLVELADGTFGFVRKSSGRYILIETFDGKEILVPNEEFIINKVINWTFSNSKGRVQIDIGISYNTDIEKAYELILEAAKEHERCIEDPEPVCFLRNFGDSSVDFTLFFWVSDVALGRWGPQSDVMFTIWRKFKEHDIHIPFPQRDLHLKTPDILKVQTHGN